MNDMRGQISQPRHSPDALVMAVVVKWSSLRLALACEVVKSPFSSCLKIERAKRRLDPHFSMAFVKFMRK